MKKKVLIVFGIMAIIVLGLGGKWYMDSKKQEEEMLTIVKSEEAKKVFEEGLKKLDPKAFTTDGIIQSYEIDEQNIKQNPMGGMNITIFVNKKSNLYVYFILNKNDSGKLIDDGGGNSSELEKLLKGETDE